MGDVDHFRACDVTLCPSLGLRFPHIPNHDTTPDGARGP